MEVPATPAELRDKATHYREMILMVSDQRIIDALRSLAEDYEALAEQLESSSR